MRRSNQNKNNISDTLENWDSITYNNPLLEYIWQLLRGFILWQIWKERNKKNLSLQSLHIGLNLGKNCHTGQGNNQKQTLETRGLKLQPGGAIHTPQLAA